MNDDMLTESPTTVVGEKTNTISEKKLAGPTEAKIVQHLPHTKTADADDLANLAKVNGDLELLTVDLTGASKKAIEEGHKAKSLEDQLLDEATKVKRRAYMEMYGCFGSGGMGASWKVFRDIGKEVWDSSRALRKANKGDYSLVIKRLEKEQGQFPGQLEALQAECERVEKELQNVDKLLAPELLAIAVKDNGDGMQELFEKDRKAYDKVMKRKLLNSKLSGRHYSIKVLSERKGHVNQLLNQWHEKNDG
jgi:hypothetical protein